MRVPLWGQLFIRYFGHPFVFTPMNQLQNFGCNRLDRDCNNRVASSLWFVCEPVVDKNKRINDAVGRQACLGGDVGTACKKVVVAPAQSSASPQGRACRLLCAEAVAPRLTCPPLCPCTVALMTTCTSHRDQAAPGVRRRDERASGEGRRITQRRVGPCASMPIRGPMRTPAGGEVPCE